MAESFENLHIILRGWAKDFLQDLWISQFNPAFAVSFHPTRSADCRVKFDSGMRDFPGSIFDQSQIFGTHSNQWVCVILHRLRQIWLFSRSCSPKWTKAGFRVMLEDFEIYKKASVFCSSASSLSYQTNIFYLAVHLFSNRLQKTSSCGTNNVDTLGYRLVCHLLFLPHFRVIWDLLLNRGTATRKLFVK